MATTKVTQMSLFDNVNPIQRKRVSRGRTQRTKDETQRVFRAFLVACKQTIDEGKRFHLRRLQNQYHVGHFPQSLMPFAELRAITLAEVDLDFVSRFLAVVQQYNASANRQAAPRYSRPQERQTHLQTRADAIRESVAKVIDDAITSLQILRSQLV